MVPPTYIATSFPVHTHNGVNIIIVNATNNTEYICVSLIDGMVPTDSEPVYLYVAGTYVYCIATVYIFAHLITSDQYKVCKTNDRVCTCTYIRMYVHMYIFIHKHN